MSGTVGRLTQQPVSDGQAGTTSEGERFQPDDGGETSGEQESTSGRAVQPTGWRGGIPRGLEFEMLLIKRGNMGGGAGLMGKKTSQACSTNRK